MNALAALLDSVQCTKPFTLEDMSALLQLVKQHAPNDLVDVFDVCGRGEIISVTVGNYAREYPIV